MDLCDLTTTELGKGYREGNLSPVEVTEAHLHRIDSLNSETHDYITVTSERALSDARQAEAAFRDGKDVGPLQGVPIALKDLVDTKGITTTAGTKVWANRVPDRDGTVARRLARAGTVLLGKTNLVEFAFGPYGVNTHYGTPPNPWDAACVPGGSSSGSGGAVGRGMAVAAIGTDTGGSIRLPASFCGIVGLKPTVQSVSRAGVVPLCWTLDSVGPLTRRVIDAAHVFDAIAGPDPEDRVTRGARSDYIAAGLDEEVRGLKVGRVVDPFEDGADEEMVACVDASCEVLEALGVHVEPFVFPEAREELQAELEGRGSITLMGVEGYATHRETLEGPGPFDERIKARIGGGKKYSGVDYAEALRERERLAAAAERRLRDVDAVIAPTTLYPAPRIDEAAVAPARLTTRLVNFLGLCAVSVPCGFTKSGLPAGLQIIGRPFSEARIMRLAHAYEQATPWHRQRPD